MTNLVLTDVGYAAAMRAKRHGVHISVDRFEVRQYGTDYTPYRTDASLRGTVLYTGGIDRTHVTKYGDRIYRLFVPDSSTPGSIYEVGLYLSTGELYALGVCSPRYDKTYPYQLRIYCYLRAPKDAATIDFEGILTPTVPAVSRYSDLPLPHICGNNVFVVKDGHCGGDSNRSEIELAPTIVCKWKNGDEWAIVNGSLVHTGSPTSFDVDDGLWLTLPPTVDVSGMDLGMLHVVKGPGRYSTRRVLWNKELARLDIRDAPLMEALDPSVTILRLWTGPGCCAGIYL